MNAECGKDEEKEGEAVYGHKHNIRDSGFRIQDSGYRIQDSGFRIQDSGYRIQDTVPLVRDLRRDGTRLEIQDSG